MFDILYHLISLIFKGHYIPLVRFVGSDVTLYLFLFQNLHQMSSSLLEMLDNPDESTREFALSLLVEILEKQVSLFSPEHMYF